MLVLSTSYAYPRRAGFRRYFQLVELHSGIVFFIFSRAANNGTRVRSFGSITTTIVFVGTAILAPFSVPTAFAAGDQFLLTPADSQTLTSAAASDDALDLGVEVAGESPSAPEPVDALYYLEQSMFQGSVTWGGYRFTYYREQVLPGGGLAIPGRHLNADGYVSDKDGFIVLAGSAPKGTVYETPFGSPGKIYDRGTVGNHLDVYIR